MPSEIRRNKIVTWFGSFFLLGSFAMTFLILGLGFADDFTTGFGKARELVTSNLPFGAQLWAAMVFVFFPSSLLMFLLLLWRLKEELENSTLDILKNARRRWDGLRGDKSADSD